MNAKNTSSLLALANPGDRRDRAVPFARRLAAGVGSRVTSSRNIARRLGEAQLAEQTQFGLPKPRRFLGRAVASATAMGGRHVSGSAIRRANVGQGERLHDSRGAVTGFGHWREHGDLQPARRSAAQEVAHPTARAVSARWNLDFRTGEEHIFGARRLYRHFLFLVPGLSRVARQDSG